MMVVRSRLQLTLAILKPDLMMHPVRTKVRKVLVRFLRCPIHLFMRQSHIISHKIEWASEVEAYISLMWWACAEILPLLTPETFPCLVPDTPYTSLFLPPDIPLPSYPTSFSLFYPPPGLSESFEVHSWVVKVSSQSRDILFKKRHPQRNAKQSSRPILTK